MYSIRLSFFLVISLCIGIFSFADVTAAVETFDRSSQDDLKEGDYQSVGRRATDDTSTHALPRGS